MLLQNVNKKYFLFLFFPPGVQEKPEKIYSLSNSKYLLGTKYKLPVCRNNIEEKMSVSTCIKSKSYFFFRVDINAKIKQMSVDMFYMRSDDAENCE